MKICLIAPIPPFRGGIAKYCYGLAKELEQRHELLLLSYRRQYPHILYRKSQIDPGVDAGSVKAEFSRLSYDIDSASIVSWYETARKVAAFAPDLVILPWFVVYWGPMYLYLLYALQRRGVKVLILCINVFEHEDNGFKRFLSKLVLSSTDLLLVHSEQEKNEILSFHPRARVAKHLLPLFEYEAPAPAASGGAGGLKLLFFGLVRPYKGLDTLLRALSLLKDREITLKVAGEFWHDKDDYLRLIEELGISHMVEVVDRYIPQDELASYFSWADLVTLPYKRTKTSGIIATAYGFGKPVLATRVGGFYEVIEDGVTGKMVQPDDPEAFAAGVRWFLEHRAVDFAANIARFSSHRMSWSSLVTAIEELACR